MKVNEFKLLPTRKRDGSSDKTTIKPLPKSVCNFNPKNHTYDDITTNNPKHI